MPLSLAMFSTIRSSSAFIGFFRYLVVYSVVQKQKPPCIAAGGPCSSGPDAAGMDAPRDDRPEVFPAVLSGAGPGRRGVNRRRRQTGGCHGALAHFMRVIRRSDDNRGRHCGRLCRLRSIPVTPGKTHGPSRRRPSPTSRAASCGAYKPPFWGKTSLNHPDYKVNRGVVPRVGRRQTRARTLAVSSVVKSFRVAGTGSVASECSPTRGTVLIG